MTLTSKDSSELAVFAVTVFEDWFNKLDRYNEDFPAKGSVGGALVVLERLKRDYELNIESHTAAGGSQIRGASGAAVKRLLLKFGETRRFVAEGGRTNRGLRGDIKKMLDVIATLGLDRLADEDREKVIEKLQQFLVDKVRQFHAQRRLECRYSTSFSAYQAVASIFKAARERGKEGPVAQYFVGAKLQLRFPNQSIENKSYSTADAPQDHPGDFLVGDTVFHVTVAPALGVLDKCRRNIEEALRPWLLVPERLLALFRHEAEEAIAGPFTMGSIESFVSQNVAELAEFSGELLPGQLLRLLEVYNRRVGETEVDGSMLIEIPAALERACKIR